MKTLDTRAVPVESRAAVALFHPIELALILLLATLAHFLWHEHWNGAFWIGVFAFGFLPRGEIFSHYGSFPQWNWIVLRWLTLGELLLLFFATLFLYNEGDSWLL